MATDISRDLSYCKKDMDIDTVLGTSRAACHLALLGLANCPEKHGQSSRMSPQNQHVPRSTQPLMVTGATDIDTDPG